MEFVLFLEKKLNALGPLGDVQKLYKLPNYLNNVIAGTNLPENWYCENFWLQQV